MRNGFFCISLWFSSISHFATHRISSRILRRGNGLFAHNQRQPLSARSLHHQIRFEKAVHGNRGARVKNDGQDSGLISCKTCGQVQRFSAPPNGFRVECGRCGDVLMRKRSYPRASTAAFALAALFLYVPANIYPVMVMQYLGRETENTVWAGVRALYHDGLWGVATIVFCASILVPLLKLLGLIFLVSVRGSRWQKGRTRIHKLIKIIGPWAMLDVFLLAIMVALIRFGSFATVIPGPGIFAFTAVVVLTLIASANFDPHLIWENTLREHDPQTAT
jgi:paraquat-inducible protein A